MLSDFERRVLKDLTVEGRNITTGAAYNQAKEALIDSGYIKKDQLNVWLELTEKGKQELSK